MAAELSVGVMSGGISAIVLYVVVDWLGGLKKEPELARLEKRIETLENQNPQCDDTQCQEEFAGFRQELTGLRDRIGAMEGFLKAHTNYVETAMRDGAARMDGLQNKIDTVHLAVVQGFKEIAVRLPG